MEGEQKRLDLSVLPDVIFTDPQVAAVGLTEAHAIERGYDFKTTTLSLAHASKDPVDRPPVEKLLAAQRSLAKEAVL